MAVCSYCCRCSDPSGAIFICEGQYQHSCVRSQPIITRIFLNTVQAEILLDSFYDCVTFSGGWFQGYPPQTCSPAASLSAPHSTHTKPFHPAHKGESACEISGAGSSEDYLLLTPDRERRSQSQPSTFALLKLSAFINVSSFLAPCFTIRSPYFLNIFLFFAHSLIGSCTKQRSCRHILSRQTMKMWTRMRLVMTIFCQRLFRVNALHTGNILGLMFKLVYVILKAVTLYFASSVSLLQVSGTSFINVI